MKRRGRDQPRGEMSRSSPRRRHRWSCMSRTLIRVLDKGAAGPRGRELGMGGWRIGLGEGCSGSVVWGWGNSKFYLHQPLTFKRYQCIKCDNTLKLYLVKIFFYFTVTPKL